MRVTFVSLKHDANRTKELEFGISPNSTGVFNKIMVTKTICSSWLSGRAVREIIWPEEGLSAATLVRHHQARIKCLPVQRDRTLSLSNSYMTTESWKFLSEFVYLNRNIVLTNWLNCKTGITTTFITDGPIQFLSEINSQTFLILSSTAFLISLILQYFKNVFIVEFDKIIGVAKVCRSLETVCSILW